jgi:hypothetical protein
MRAGTIKPASPQASNGQRWANRYRASSEARTYMRGSLDGRTAAASERDASLLSERCSRHDGQPLAPIAAGNGGPATWHAAPEPITRGIPCRCVARDSGRYTGGGTCHGGLKRTCAHSLQSTFADRIGSSNRCRPLFFPCGVARETIRNCPVSARGPGKQGVSCIDSSGQDAESACFLDCLAIEGEGGPSNLPGIDAGPRVPLALSAVTAELAPPVLDFLESVCGGAP